MMTHAARVARTLLVTCCVLLVSVASAGAHGVMTRSVSPPASAVVRGDEQIVTVRLSSAATIVQPTVTGPRGGERPAAFVGSSTGTVVRIRVTFLQPGAHVVSWGLVQADGHVTHRAHPLRVVLPEQQHDESPMARSPLRWLLALLAALF